jgi:radical SAM superfamily enzyme YgiQ (UPF0313 family)
MKILLISPSSGKWRHVGRQRLFNGRTFRFSMLSLLSVAAETPPGDQVRIVDEQIDAIPWDADVDLVGITCMTALAPRAYEIAAGFRDRGIPVVLGGMHPTFCPQEALQHADAVVAGEAEGVWPRVVEAARLNQLAGVYRNVVPPDLSQLKAMPRHLLQPGRYATLHAVQATRGCTHACDFCSISAYHQRTQRRRPVEEVAQEIAAIPGRFFVFVDDNLIADRDYGRRLFDRLRPLRKRWITQCTLSLANDPDLVRRAAEAGCVGVFVGMESFSEENLHAVNKRFNRVEKYRDAIQRLHAHGIAVEAGIVFGLPADRPQVFETTLRQLDELQVDAIQVSIATPLPGTPQYEARRAELMDRNWAHYDLHHVVVEPRGMSSEALQAGHDWVTREFYRPWRVARRIWRQLWRPRGWQGLACFVAINLAYLGRVQRWHIRGWNPILDAGRREPGPRPWLPRLEPAQG